MTTSPASGSIGQRAARGSLVLWAMQLVLRFNQFFVMLVLARLLQPEHYGVIAIAAATATIIDVAGNVQVGQALIRLRVVRREHTDTAFTLNIMRGVLSSLVIAAIALPVADFTDSPDVALALVGLIPMVLAQSLQNPHFILYQRGLQFGPEARRQLAAAAVSAVLSIAFAVFYPSFWALVVSLVANSAVATAMSWWRVPGRPGLGLSAWREMLGFGVWLTAANVIRELGNRSDIFLVSRAIDPAMTGNYHVAQKVLQVAGGELASPMQRSVYPAVAAMQDDRARARRAVWKAQSTLFVLILPLGLGLALLAEPAVLLLLGDRWRDVVPIVTVLAPVHALSALTLGPSVAAMALGRTRLLFWRSFTRSALRIFAVVAGYLWFGFIGILMGRMLSVVVVALMNMVMLRTLLGGPLFAFMRYCGRGLVAGAALVGTLLLLPASGRGGDALDHAVTLVAHAAAGGIVYAATLLGLWHLAGRPDGAEAGLLQQVGGALRRLQRGTPPPGRPRAAGPPE